MMLAVTQVVFAGFPTVSNKESTASRPKYEIYTPQINGLENGEAQSAINKALAEVPNTALKEYREATSYIDKEIKNNNRSSDLMNALILMVNYDVKLLTKKTFSIVEQSYMYSGGAHGITTTVGKTFDLRTGREYSLGDLFDTADYTQNINRIIREEITARGKQDLYRFTGLQNNQAFFISKEGLFIFFQQYEIAPYSEGIITFFIPYSQLTGFKSQIVF